MTIFNYHEQKFRSYFFGSLFPLDSSILDRLIAIFKYDQIITPGSLKGRTCPKFTTIAGEGTVFVKSYIRGGMISKLNRNRYLKIGKWKIRSKKEFEFLMHAKKAGVRVPTPLAYATQGRLFYKTWLITREVENHNSFIDLCRNDKKKAAALLPEISRSIKRLIKNRIHHVDLHPGNILIDKNNKNYIIDFDKAYFHGKNGKILAGKYQKRWAKAIKKYNLPEEFSTLDLSLG